MRSFPLIPLFRQASGLMWFAACVIALFVGFSNVISPSESVLPRLLLSVLIGLPAVFLIFYLASTQKVMVTILCAVSILLLLLSGKSIPAALPQALTTNLSLITLIISVSFLRLIVHPEFCQQALPTDKKSMWQTIVGLHFLSAVINLPAITIFGDRIQRDNKLSPPQYMMLCRTFGADAMWSPFFASMGAALVYTNGANVIILMSLGFASAVLSMLITGWQCQRHSNNSGQAFVSYPMSWRNLSLPFFLCVVVIIGHQLMPSLSILILVAGVVLVTVLVVLLVQSGFRLALTTLTDHVLQGIPRSSSEILLFTSAGLLVVGLTAFYQAMDMTLPFAELTVGIACMGLISMVLVACLGVHPLISISVIGELLRPINPDANLLAMMFMLAWGIALPISPLSGVNLVMQSRYQVQASDAFRYNTRFTVLMLAFGCIVLNMVDKMR